MSKILIVEDEPDMVTGLKDNFEFEGYEVQTASDGQSGLEQARKPECGQIKSLAGTRRRPRSGCGVHFTSRYGLLAVCSASKVKVVVVAAPWNVLPVESARLARKQSVSELEAFSVRSPACAP